MPRCPGCSAEAPVASLFCPSCGNPLDAKTTTAPARDPARHSAPTSGHGQHTRFLPGTVLAGRYRIVGLLGRGGMGEVYRADDLKLGQPVALKFLAPGLEGDPRRLERLLAEVRIARQVAHSNVCRVYDVGESADGGHFLTMEFVDGEDLSSLLRRIGRLPEDKALQIAQQLCAGLAAVHGQGLLHRDLKPANVMIDGRGNARLTDFGLAGDAAGFSGSEIHSGTPGYMAPEQREGREVTVRSDIWALGQVLHELFTGRRPAADGRASSNSGVELPASVARVIRSCLEQRPEDRPASAVAIAASLPGGGALAVALAAGETPSPQMVAEAGAGGSLSHGVALAALTIVVVGFLLGAWIWKASWLVGQVDLPQPPEVLAAAARELLARSGHAEAPADREWGFLYDRAQRDHVAASTDPDRWRDFSERRPAPIFFWYRESPGPLRTESFQGIYVRPDDPPALVSGMAHVSLEPGGRLLRFEVVPPEHDSTPATTLEPDWTLLLEAAQVDPTAVRETTPQWSPGFDCDLRRAWIARLPAFQDSSAPRQVEVRVEAGSWRGKAVYFRVVWPWTEAQRMRTSSPLSTLDLVGLLVLLGLLIVGVAVARYNVRHGRGDRRGALRIGAVFFGLNMFVWLFGADHVGGIGEAGLLFLGLAWGLLTGAMVWLGYLAVEPWARRIWPDVLITWSRLLAGRFRDPMIGRDILLGAAAGILLDLLTRFGNLAPAWLGGPAPEPLAIPVGGFPEGILAVLDSVRMALAFYAFLPQMAISGAISALFLVILLRVTLRRPLPAYVAAWLLFTSFGVLAIPGATWLTVVIAAINAAISILVLVRLGLFAMCVQSLFTYLPNTALLTLEPGAWYFGRTLILLALMALLLAWGFHLGVRPASDPRGS